MAYVLPQVLVSQEFQDVPDTVVDPLRAHISGGNAILFRYAESDEKAQAALGSYDPTTDTTYYWPNRPTGGIVDQSYAKLYVDDALLQYFNDAVGSGATIAPVSGYANRVRADSLIFKSSSNSTSTYSRSAAFYDRDVQPGDVVDLQAVISGNTYTLRTTVLDLVADKTTAVIGSPTPDSNNAATQSASSSTTYSGPSTNITASEDASSYDGTPTGHINETYVVEVTTGSTGQDFTTARVSVTSSSGTDDATNVPVAASGNPTTIGSRGLTLTLTQGTPAEDLVPGQKWTITVQQAFNAPTATSSGSYTGQDNTTYIVKVTRGGQFTSATPPQISVTTTHGVDVSGPTDVTAASTPVPVGTKGVQIDFSGSGVDRLNYGDIWYIDVTASEDAEYRTLVLANDLSATMQTATDMDLTLYIRKSGEVVPHERASTPGAYNYEFGTPGVTDTQFTVKSGIELYDDSWTDNGTQLPLPLKEGQLYMEYRAWICDKGNQVYGISDIADIDDIPGPLHPDNPLKWGVYKALTMSNGTEVKYTAVCEPDSLDSWQDVIEAITGDSSTYGLVPLTKDENVLAAFVSHVNQQSTETENRWRVLWANLAADETVSIVSDATSSDGNTVLATISDDPNSTGTQYTLVQVPAGNGNFVTNGVQPGDVMRYEYATDAWGNETYVEYIIDQVINEDSLLLKTGQGTSEQPVAKKMEVWRTLDATALAEQLAGKAAAYGNTRVRAVWPDQVDDGSYTYDGYFLCALLAGARSGVAPNQSLTNMELSGISDVGRTYNLFNKTQLDTMANAGVWIVTRTDDGSIITRHGLTTAGYGDVLKQEEMVISNVDSCSYVFLTSMEDVIGKYNVTPNTLDILELRARGIIEYLKEVRVERLGGQVVDGEIVSVRQHSIFLDRVVMDIKLTIPVPLNNLEVNLQIVSISGLGTAA